jgi:peptide/nickel transport system substrate-binding protein
MLNRLHYCRQRAEPGLSNWRYLTLAALALALPLFGGEDRLILDHLTGVPGGALSFAQRAEPKTLNPALASDAASREVLQRLHADLIHINRETQRTEPALAKSWTVSNGGLRYTLELRRELRFSDGKPFTADDVVFSFQVYLDEKINSPQRDLLVLDGKPIIVKKLGPYRVEFTLPRPYAAAERLFDGFAILPQHLLGEIHRQGKLGQAWGLNAPPAGMAGMGPFRLKQYAPGQRIALERNPFYWKADRAGHRLPYLNEATFTFAGSEDMQVMRFEAGEADVISRVGARNFAVLQKSQAARGYTLADLGSGLEYSFLFFNLGDMTGKNLPQVAASQAFLRRVAFRRAVSAAVDRNAMARLVYQGHAVPLGSPLPPGNRNWINPQLPAPVRSVAHARELLAADGFKWAKDGALLAPGGRKVEFSLITSSSNAERVQMATLIQDDLKQIGMDVHVVPLDSRSLLDRVQQTRDYEAALLSLANGDADPNPDMAVWLSSGGLHLWNPEQKTPATTWEAEIDGLMRRQMVTLKYAGRKRMFDRVQAIIMENLPLIPLVSPSILVGARKELANFRPALMDHYVLWNIDELYWRPNSGPRTK